MEDDKYRDGYEDGKKDGYENGIRDADANWMKIILKWLVGVVSAASAALFAIVTDFWSK